MQPQTYLTVTSVLFWLVALIAAGIIFIGARFIVAPLPAAKGFGVPASKTEQSTYLWTKGTRDIVSGLLVIGLLWLKVSVAFLFIASLIPLGDLLNVYAHVGTKNVPALAIHGGTAVVMCVLAALVLHA
jgi:Domain of unknown function (DUF4267)